MLHLDTAGLSDIGKKRGNQEDAFLVDDAHGLYVVADGMGGHLAGEVASTMVVETMRAAALDPDKALSDSPESGLSPETDRLLSWIRYANSKIFQRSQQDPQCRGMGSTVAALYCTSTRLVSANVGDSPIYRMRGNCIELISAIHTVAAERAAGDQPEPGVPNMFNHMLTRAVGIEPEVQPAFHETDIHASDVYVLCSDGLSNAVQPQQIHAIVHKANARQACRGLVNLANARGGEDNITVIVIKALKD